MDHQASQTQSLFLPIELYSKVWVEDYSTPIDRKSSTLALFRTTDQRCLCPYDVYEEIFGAPPEAETVNLELWFKDTKCEKHPLELNFLITDDTTCMVIGHSLMKDYAFHSLSSKHLMLKRREDPSRLAKIKYKWMNTLYPYARIPILHKIQGKNGRSTPPPPNFHTFNFFLF